MITIINNNVTSTEGKYIQRKGSPFLGLHNSQAIPGDTPDDWMEVDEAPINEQEYKAKIQELIALKYSISDEIALLNNLRDGTPEHIKEYEEYNSYREECKIKVKEMFNK